MYSGRYHDRSPPGNRNRSERGPPGSRSRNNDDSSHRPRAPHMYANSNSAFYQKFQENYRKQMSGERGSQLYQSAFPLKHIPEKLNFSYRLLGRNIFNKASPSSGNISDSSARGAERGVMRRKRKMEKRFKNYMRYQAQQGTQGSDQQSRFLSGKSSTPLRQENDSSADGDAVKKPADKSLSPNNGKGGKSSKKRSRKESTISGTGDSSKAYSASKRRKIDKRHNDDSRSRDRGRTGTATVTGKSVKSKLEKGKLPLSSVSPGTSKVKNTANQIKKNRANLRKQNKKQSSGSESSYSAIRSGSSDMSLDSSYSSRSTSRSTLSAGSSFSSLVGKSRRRRTLRPANASPASNLTLPDARRSRKNGSRQPCSGRHKRTSRDSVSSLSSTSHSPGRHRRKQTGVGRLFRESSFCSREKPTSRVARRLKSKSKGKKETEAKSRLRLKSRDPASRKARKCRSSCDGTKGGTPASVTTAVHQKVGKSGMPGTKANAVSEEDETIDLQRDSLQPISAYVNNREMMLEEVFKCIRGKKLEAMMPSILKTREPEEIRARCLDQLECMSKKRILHILGAKEMTSSSGTDDSTDEGPQLPTAVEPNAVQLATSTMNEAKPNNNNNNEDQLSSIIMLEANAQTFRPDKMRPIDQSLDNGEDFTERIARRAKDQSDKKWKQSESNSAPSFLSSSARCVHADEDFDDYYEEFKRVRKLPPDANNTENHSKHVGNNNETSYMVDSDKTSASGRTSSNSEDEDEITCLKRQHGEAEIDHHHECSECGESYSSVNLLSPSSYDSECSGCEYREKLKQSQDSYGSLDEDLNDEDQKEAEQRVGRRRQIDDLFDMHIKGKASTADELVAKVIAWRKEAGRRNTRASKSTVDDNGSTQLDSKIADGMGDNESNELSNAVSQSSKYSELDKLPVIDYLKCLELNDPDDGLLGDDESSDNDDDDDDGDVENSVDSNAEREEPMSVDEVIDEDNIMSPENGTEASNNNRRSDVACLDQVMEKVWEAMVVDKTCAA